MRMRSPFLVAFAAALLAGCSSGPDFERPAKPTSTGYTPESLAPQTSAAGGPGGAAQSFVPAMDIPGEWWTLFHSPQLDTLIKEALQANPDIDAAQAALRQARENFYAQQGSLFPTLSANGQGQQQLASLASQGQTGPAIMYGVTTASLNVSYSPDVFGGVRRQVESKEALAEVQRFQLEATYLSLTSNVVVAAINLASLQAQINATQDIIRILENSLGVVRRQFDLGGASRADVLAQEATLTQTRATLPPLAEAARPAAQPADAPGRPLAGPGSRRELRSRQAEAAAGPAAQPALAAGRAAARRARRRGDSCIRPAPTSASPSPTRCRSSPSPARWASLRAASARCSCRAPACGASGSASPRRSSMAPGSTTSARPRSRPTSARPRSTRAPCCRPSRTSPTRLRALQADADALRAQVEAEQTAAASLRLSEQQYQLGGVSYLILLNAQQTYQTAVINRLKAQAARYADTAALFQALGGGWWNRTDVDPKSMGKPGYFALPPVQDIKLPAGADRRPLTLEFSSRGTQ